MTKRISQHYKDKQKPGRSIKFNPTIEEWTDACQTYCFDTQICKHFDVHKETFYLFLDRQRYEKEQGRAADFLDVYKMGRNKTTKFAIDNLKINAERGDPAATIFFAKTFGGLIEAKDIKHIELKKYEMAFKSKQFMTELAKKFELNYEELNTFANKYFSDAKLDDI